jgi:hypothetical protein
MPPALAPLAIGLSTTTWFPLTMLWRRTSLLAKRLSIPPLFGSLAADGPAELEPAVLFVTRVFVRVNTPPLSMPPPRLKPQGRGPQNPGGIAEFEVTTFPVISLFEIATVAPVPSKGGWSSCATGIQTPPANVTSGSGCVLLTPPVM